MRSSSVFLKVSPKKSTNGIPSLEMRGNIREENLCTALLSGSGNLVIHESSLWAVILKDLKCFGEEMIAYIWLMRSFGNWAPRPTETRVYLWPPPLKAMFMSGNTPESPEVNLLALEPSCLGPSAFPGDRFPTSALQYLEERWITYWWLQGNLMCPTKCCEKLNVQFFFF